MIKLAANISTLFNEVAFLDRIDAAARAGFQAIECQFPYAEEPDAIAHRLREHGMKWVLFNGPPGSAEAGERGIASLPGREADFRAGIGQAMEYLAAADCRQLHVMAGLLPPGADRERHLDQFIESIALAADLLRPVGATVLVEPINTRVDVPRYLIDGTALAIDCIARCGRSNVRLQYDVYHMQIMEGDLLRSVERLLPSIGHIQIADNPGRHEPGSGEINFEVLLPAIAALGYDGWIGCEYLPHAGTDAGLAWASRHLSRVSP